MNDLHGIVLAYRSHENLGELTRHRNTCSLPFGGRYRLIDFMLSNYVNAGISDVGVIVHESYQSLLDHVGTGKDWDLSRKHGGLRILPPFGYADRGHNSGEYRGSMEALSVVRSYLEAIRQEYVIVAWGDMAVNLPVAEIFQQHMHTGADITMVCTPACHSDTTHTSDYVTTNEFGQVTDLSLHPLKVCGALESMEIYVLSKTLLLDLVEYCSAHNQYSLSKNVLQSRLGTLKIMSYVHKDYVARCHSVASYFERSMELLDADVRRALFHPDRPIRTKDMSNPSTYYGSNAHCECSLISDGCYIEGEVYNCILSRGVVIEAGVKISNCILMQNTIVRSGASMAYTITDKDVLIHSNRMLMGHSTYPLAIAKKSVV